MGWTFTSGATKKNVISEITTQLTGPAMKSIAKCIKGNALWVVFEYTQEQNGHKLGDRWIGCFLLGAEKGFGWGYKDMTESMGPCAYTCPLSYLEMVPCPGGYAAEWREKVRAYHARDTMLRNVKEYDVVVLLPGCTPERLVVVDRQGRKIIGVDASGQRYRIVGRVVARVEPAVVS